jgi:hypothetical protein
LHLVAIHPHPFVAAWDNTIYSPVSKNIGLPQLVIAAPDLQIAGFTFGLRPEGDL